MWAPDLVDSTGTIVRLVSDPSVVVRSGGLGLRSAIDSDDDFQGHLRRPDVAGEFNSFGDLIDDRVDPTALGVRRVIAVLDDGTPVASLSCIGIPHGPNRQSVAWNIGITVVPEHRGRGYGALAQRLLARHLFATTAANRVEADTDVDNLAEQRALERAGFRREGILRQAQYRGGRWHDLVLYAVVRADDP